MGLYSTAITWEGSPKKHLYLMMLLSFGFAASTAIVDARYMFCLPGFVAAYGYLFHLLGRLDLNDRGQCGQFFRRNNYIGVFIFLSLIMRGIFAQDKS